MNSLEFTILNNLVTNDQFRRQTFPYLKKEYFEEEHNKLLFDLISNFINKYEKCPTKESLAIDLQNVGSLTDQQFKISLEAIDKVSNEKVDQKWLVDSTEEWCRNRAIYLSLLESIQIADGKDDKKDKGAIPSILSDAIAVSFDNRIGHDYFSNYKERFEFYNKVEEKIPFDLSMFNKITKGGLSNKTLNVALAGTGVGKSLFMCHVAAATLLQGKNVLYITCEMSEEKIAERIDANLLNTNIKDIKDLPHNTFTKKIDKLAAKTTGKLIVKEYPTASAHAGHFRALLQELKLKKSFEPDIIFVDYLNICASSRYRGSVNINSYTYVKSIAEELRGLAVETSIPLFSATQTTRSGFASSDPDLTDTSESFGLPATADLMFALISTEDLEQLNQIMVKQLKNRYNDPTMNRRFVVGIDRAKMRLYDCEQDAQSDIMIDENDTAEYNEKESKAKFDDFKF